MLETTKCEAMPVDKTHDDVEMINVGTIDLRERTQPPYPDIAVLITSASGLLAGSFTLAFNNVLVSYCSESRGKLLSVRLRRDS